MTLVGIFITNTHYSKMPDLLVKAMTKFQKLLSSNFLTSSNVFTLYLINKI